MSFMFYVDPGSFLSDCNCVGKACPANHHPMCILNSFYFHWQCQHSHCNELLSGTQPFSAIWFDFDEVYQKHVWPMYAYSTQLTVNVTLWWWLTFWHNPYGRCEGFLHWWPIHKTTRLQCKLSPVKLVIAVMYLPMFTTIEQPRSDQEIRIPS